jgi:hypothetical protein
MSSLLALHPRRPISHTRFGASFTLFSCYIVWQCADAAVSFTLCVLCLFGLVVILGLWEPDPNHGTKPGGIMRLYLAWMPLHWFVWAAAFALTSYELYQVLGEPAPRTGGLAVAFAILISMYSGVGYIALSTAASWYTTWDHLHRLLFGSRDEIGASARRDRLILRGIIVASCFSFACWITTNLVKVFDASIATDLPYAVGIGEDRHGTLMDAQTKWKGRDSLLAFVVSLAQTWRNCPTIGGEDRLVGLDAHRAFVVPAITTKDKFGETTEWPLDKGQIKVCENG